MSEAHTVRALIAPVPGNNILLPGSIVAEVVNYSEPEPYSSAPSWLLGEFRWSGWQVPVVHFSRLAGTSDHGGIPDRSRILVVRTLCDASSVVHIGFLISGLPRMKSVSTGNLVEKGGGQGVGVYSQVSVDEQPAVIPDLDGLALAIEQAVYSR
jgi:chemosensory pili system protein ChpC